jgi:hypothetical protein
VARARQILFHKPQTLAHEDSRRVSSIHHRLKQLNRGETWGDQGKALGLLLEAGEAWTRSYDAVEAQELQAAASSSPWIVFSAKS